MEADKLIESIFRAFMFMAGILGNNWLAVVSLPRKMSEIHTNEVLFINLAVSNLITNYLVDLPDTAVDFAGRWFLGETYCGIFHFCSDLSETSSIFTTLFISAFWHQKLVGSLRRGGAPVPLDSLHLVGCLLAGSWMLAVAFGVPHYFFASLERRNESHESCVQVFPDALSRQTYETTYLTVANVLPLAGIFIASVQIVVTLLQNQKRILSHNSDPAKQMIKGESESKSINTISVGIVSDPGTAKELKDSSSRIHTQVEKSPKHRAGSSPQARAAKSVVAVASMVVVCWLTHLLLRISSNIHTSSVVLEVASYVAASYNCIIPYIFLYGVKKMTCSCKTKG
ncbi:putative neuropeptide Y receptor type 6 [Nothobranchius furzeri]|uniref:Olfactory receptor class A related 5 n=2 Tax=Nothobranchius furzeri TaxID=105023 RepID=A0A1A8ASR2_NOTFU|nr:rhodopsin-like [Nothobranchius furzeri]